MNPFKGLNLNYNATIYYFSETKPRIFFSKIYSLSKGSKLFWNGPKWFFTTEYHLLNHILNILVCPKNLVRVKNNLGRSKNTLLNSKFWITEFRALLKNNKYNGHYFDRQTEKTKERSSSSHVFTNSETTKLQFFSWNFLCFVFLQVRSFLLRSKMTI